MAVQAALATAAPPQPPHREPITADSYAAAAFAAAANPHPPPRLRPSAPGTPLYRPPALAVAASPPSPPSPLAI